MKNELSLALLPLTLIIGSSLGQQSNPCPPASCNHVTATNDDIRMISSFGLDLFRKLKAQFPRENIFCSPYSVWALLSIVYFGAEGNTLDQLEKVLKFGGKDKLYEIEKLLSAKRENITGVQLDEANRAYLSKSLVLEECFKRGESYDIHQVDFSDPDKLAQEINEFVNRTTKGLIPELVKGDSLEGTLFVLVNAVYFKGFWEQPFNKKFTSSRDFFCNSSIPCGQVEMMSESSYFNYFDYLELGAEVLELPYANSSMSMFALLPRNGSTVDDVVDRFDLQALATIINNLSSRRTLLQFPKFKMEQTFEKELLMALQELGIKDLFSLDGDLSALTKSVRLGVGTIIQKAAVNVNEEGTEAAAATGAISPTSLPPRLYFNRPFVFMIVDKDPGLILFSGIYRSPPV